MRGSIGKPAPLSHAKFVTPTECEVRKLTRCHVGAEQTIEFLIGERRGEVHVPKAGKVGSLGNELNSHLRFPLSVGGYDATHYSAVSA